MKPTLRAPLPDAPALSAIGAAICLIVALEALPGVDHRSTAIGLTTALVLVGTSVSASLASGRRRRRDECGLGPSPYSPGDVFVAILVGFAYAALSGLAVTVLKSAWIVDANLMVATVLLGSAFAAALGALLGVTARGRRDLCDHSLLSFCVLLTPVPLCCGDNLPEVVCRVVAWWPSVALNDLLCAAFLEHEHGSGPLAEAATLLGATAVMLAIVIYRTDPPLSRHVSSRSPLPPFDDGP